MTLEKHKEPAVSSAPSVGNFLIVDNDDSDDNDNHGSTHNRVGAVKPKCFPVGKIATESCPSIKSDQATAFKEGDSRITHLENYFFRLRFRCVSRPSDC